MDSRLLAAADEDRDNTVDQVRNERDDGQHKSRNIHPARGAVTWSATEATIAVQNGNSDHSSKEEEIDNGTEQSEEGDASEAACQKHGDEAVCHGDGRDGDDGEVPLGATEANDELQVVVLDDVVKQDTYLRLTQAVAPVMMAPATKVTK